MNKREIPSSEIGFRHLKGIPHEIKVYKVLQENGSVPSEPKKGLFAGKQTKQQNLQRASKTVLVSLIGVAVLILIIIAGAYLYITKENPPLSIDTPAIQKQHQQIKQVTHPPVADTPSETAPVKMKSDTTTRQQPVKQEAMNDTEKKKESDYNMGFE